jgi:hypothetical protein
LKDKTMPGNKKSAVSRKKRTCTSNTPILLGLSTQEKERMKRIPHLALTEFKNGSANSTHWYTLGFRLRVGVELAKAHYAQETAVQMLESFSAVERILNHTVGETNKHWYATEPEIVLIEMGLDATDAIQDETLRRDQLPAHHKANDFMKKLANL